MGDPKLMKQAIIDLAREQVQNRAHYLWGCAGNTPGASDGATYRPSHALLHPNVPDLNGGPATRPGVSVPTMFAAWVDSSDQGKLACAGRAGQEEVQALPLALPSLSIKDALALKLKAMTEDQIDEMKGRRLIPFLFRWPRPNGSLGVSGGHSTVWGQCCIGMRHFDCIGLVNYCFSDALNQRWQFGIESFTVASHAKSAGFVEVKGIGAAQPCDIVTRGSEHIGIVSDKGTAIEAMDPASGVVEAALTARPWTQVWRVPGSTWK